MNFHDVRFPTAISLASSGGPERRTDIVVMGSGHEERNTRWADSRRRFDAGYGVKTLDQLHAVIAFYEERRGALYGFRWKDPADWKSCPPMQAPASDDQLIAIGDGMRDTFQLTKTYGDKHAPWVREITKPVQGSVLVEVDGVEQAEGIAFAVDAAIGVLAFADAHVPSAGHEVRAGFCFDVPVRFESDRLEVNVMGFKHGSIPAIPVVEVRI